MPGSVYYKVLDFGGRRSNVRILSTALRHELRQESLHRINPEGFWASVGAVTGPARVRWVCAGPAISVNKSIQFHRRNPPPCFHLPRNKGVFCGHLQKISGRLRRPDSFGKTLLGRLRAHRRKPPGPICPETRGFLLKARVSNYTDEVERALKG